MASYQSFDPIREFQRPSSCPSIQIFSFGFKAKTRKRPTLPTPLEGSTSLNLKLRSWLLVLRCSNSHRLNGMASSCSCWGMPLNCDAMAIPLNIPQLLESWMNTYRDQGEFQPAGLEGSYSVILFDSQNSTLPVYRSLIGHTSIYFHARPNGMLVGTNLGDLINALPVKPKLNEIALPIYFLFRQVPGNLTLFDGVQRLQPGQLLSFDHGEFSVRQLETFEDLYSAQPISSGRHFGTV